MRWQQRPQGSNWGDFGPDDQLGRLNLIGTEQVLKGAREIQAGLSFCLSLPLDYPGGNKLNPPRHPPVLRPNLFGEGQPFVNFPVARMDPSATDVVCDDQVLLSLQYSTQWDSLAHVGAMFDADADGHAERVYYNGYRADEHIVGSVVYEDVAPFDPHACCSDHGASVARALGIENLAVKGMQGRGVMVDLAHHYRFDRRDIGIAVLVADNNAVERFPARPAPADQKHYPILPLHHHCLFKLGLPLGELWYLKDLAQWLRANHRTRFMLTAPPLRLPGAMGSPATPIATV